MINKSLNRFYLIGLSVFFLVLSDVFSKQYILYSLFREKIFGNEIVLYNNFFKTSLSLLLTFNKGAAFGWFAKQQTILLWVRIIFISIMLYYILFFVKTRLLTAALILIISGAIGNVLDFLFYKHVVDFISFKIGPYHFPVFNLADIFITLGTCLLILFFFKSPNKKRM